MGKQKGCLAVSAGRAGRDVLRRHLHSGAALPGGLRMREKRKRLSEADEGEK